MGHDEDQAGKPLLRHSTTLSVDGQSFAVTGEKTPDGRVCMRVADLSGALVGNDDPLLDAYGAAMKRRLAEVRGKPKSAGS